MKAAPFVCLAVCLIAGSHGNAEGTMELRGRLVEGGLANYDGLVVEIASLRDRTVHEHVDVMSDGSFTFRSVPEGDYDVRVTTLYGSEVVSSLMSVDHSGQPFEIRLPQRKLEKPVTGTISIQQLNHPVSKQVRKMLESGQRLIDGKHYDDAAARFREATQSAPDCMQAHAQLALALSKLGQWDAAAEEYRAAAALDPKSSVLHGNLSAALASGGHTDEAGQAAAAALKLDPRNVRAHYVLAGVLLQKKGSLEQVVSHLSAAQDGFPVAKTALGKICAMQRVTGCP